MEPCYRIHPDGTRELIQPNPMLTCINCRYSSRSTLTVCPRCGGNRINFDGEVDE